MDYRHYTIILGIVLLGVILAAGCTQGATQPAGEIKIGVVASLTGPVSNLGNGMWDSAVVAANEVNAAGGVYVKEYGGKVNITLIPGDDQSTPAGGQTAVTKLITSDKVDALVGGYSSAVTYAHEQIVAQYKVPYVVTGASSPTITHRTDIDTSYIFHHCPTTDTYGKLTTEFIDQVIRPAVNAKFNFAASRPLRLGIIYQDSAFGQGVYTAVNTTIHAENLNTQIVGAQSFKMAESDFHTTLTAMKAAKPDAIYVAAFTNEMVPMVTQARREVGLNTIFLAVENNDAPAYYKGLGEYGNVLHHREQVLPVHRPLGEHRRCGGRIQYPLYHEIRCPARHDGRLHVRRGPDPRPGDLGRGNGQQGIRPAGPREPEDAPDDRGHAERRHHLLPRLPRVPVQALHGAAHPGTRPSARRGRRSSGPTT